jgi:lipoprotein NlpI
MRRWGAVVILLGGLVAGCATPQESARYHFFGAAYGGGSADAGETCRTKTEHGLWKEAVEICTSALADPAVTPGDRSMLDHYLVVAYSGLEEYGKALAPANDMVAISPNSWEALETRAAVYGALEDYDRALADYTRSIEVDPQYNRAHLGRALVYGAQGKLDLALADIDIAVDRDWNDPHAYGARCRIRLHRSEFIEAVSDCNHALELAPGYSVAKVEKGAALYFAGDYRGAADTLADFVTYQQEEPYGLLWLHLARRRLGIDDAAQLKEQAQRVDPSRWPALIVRYFAGGVGREAVENAKPDPDPKLAGTRQCAVDYFVGEAELVAGHADDGRRLLERAVARCRSGDLLGVGARASLGRLK